MNRVRGACFDCGWRGRWRVSWVKARAELSRHECGVDMSCRCGFAGCELPMSPEELTDWQASVQPNVAQIESDD